MTITSTLITVSGCATCPVRTGYDLDDCGLSPGYFDRGLSTRLPLIAVGYDEPPVECPLRDQLVTLTLRPLAPGDERTD